MAAALLSLANISLTFGGEALLTDAQLFVRPRARIALVGRNGSGKSTLLKIAAGALEADSGERFVKPGVAVSYLSQEPDLSAYHSVEEAISAGRHDDSIYEIQSFMRALNIPENALIKNLSGGELRRTALAASLVARPDILLLDEPTNHLDLPGIIWLEEFLSKTGAAAIIISHDRRFLENTTTGTVWIDRGVTRTLDHGFKEFESWRDAFLEKERQDLHKLGRKIAEEEDWIRYGVTARRKRNMRRVAELQDLRNKLKTTRRPEGRTNISLTNEATASKRLIRAKNLNVSYNDKAIIRNFSIEIQKGDRIGVAGPNGAGKTTLINALTGGGSLRPGAVEIKPGLRIVTLDQRREILDPEMRLADAITDGRGDWITINGKTIHVTSYLRDFLFSPEQWRTPIKALSGGERGRLCLASALAKPSDLLVLDEPTNDLDLETLDALEETLGAYKGALLLVTHDRSFLDRIVNFIVTTSPDKPGEWQIYAGGYDDMVRQRGNIPAGSENGSKATKAVRNTKPPIEPTARQPAAAQKLSYKEKFALENLPGEISKLNAAIASIKEELSDPGLFERDAKRFDQLAGALTKAQSKLVEAEDEWLRLELKREALAKK